MTEKKIFLKDAQGNTIQVKHLNNTSQNEFEVEKLKGGIYFVELQLPNGKAITHQFEINHN